MTVLDRLLRKVKINQGTGCWEWQGYKNNGGYGIIGVNKETFRTHRLSWTLHRGPIPDGALVCHHCDNPCCVNPDHLFLGSQHDNVQDSIRKGKNNPAGNRKYSLEHTRKIRAFCSSGKYGVLSQAARKYGVSRQHVWSIVVGRKSRARIP